MKKDQIHKFTFLMNKMRLVFTRMKQDLNVPQAEYVALISIAERSKMRENGKEMSVSTSDVAKHIGATMPAVSKVIRNLSMKGYVKQVQSQSDRRVVHLILTEKGNEILKKDFEKRGQLMKKAFDEFGEEKTDQLLDLMAELFELLEKEAEEKDD